MIIRVYQGRDTWAGAFSSPKFYVASITPGAPPPPPRAHRAKEEHNGRMSDQRRWSRIISPTNRGRSSIRTFSCCLPLSFLHTLTIIISSQHSLCSIVRFFTPYIVEIELKDFFFTRSIYSHTYVGIVILFFFVLTGLCLVCVCTYTYVSSIYLPLSRVGGCVWRGWFRPL